MDTTISQQEKSIATIVENFCDAMGIPGVANVSAANDASATSEITESSVRGEEVTDNEEEDNNSVVLGRKNPKSAIQERTNQMRQQLEAANNTLAKREQDQLPNHSEDDTSMTSAVTG
eukprot:15005027-Ditylum_brightwellii.AAC.1